jgi:hypothetical protein
MTFQLERQLLKSLDKDLEFHHTVAEYAADLPEASYPQTE